MGSYKCDCTVIDHNILYRLDCLSFRLFSSLITVFSDTVYFHPNIIIPVTPFFSRPAVITGSGVT